MGYVRMNKNKKPKAFGIDINEIDRIRLEQIDQDFFDEPEFEESLTYEDIQKEMGVINYNEQS
jgi:hypothetical protein